MRPRTHALLGGRALTARMLLEETDARIHPLSEAAKLFIAPGLLAGTAVTTSGRSSFGFKSPLTGGTKEANVGGQLGHRLARLNIKAIVVSRAPRPTAGSGSTSTAAARAFPRRTTSPDAATTTFTANSWARR